MGKRRFEGQWVWITGASSGIGEACARAFAQEGARLVLSARRRAELERVAATCVGAAEVVIEPIDQAELSTLGPLVDRVLARTGGVDVMVHNAGVSQRSRAIETGIDVDERILRVNYLGPVALTKALLPSMVRRKRGRFVVVSSLVGVFGTPLRSSYSASKHALHGFFESLRAEHHRDGLGVTIVCPGFVRTEVSRNALTGDGSAQGTMDAATERGIAPEACAKGLLDAAARGAEEVYVGGREALAPYLRRYAPSLFSALIRRAKVT
jgi:dehydrogenase/reductase SDR family protein 7B